MYGIPAVQLQKNNLNSLTVLLIQKSTATA